MRARTILQLAIEVFFSTFGIIAFTLFLVRMIGAQQLFPNGVGGSFVIALCMSCTLALLTFVFYSPQRLERSQLVKRTVAYCLASAVICTILLAIGNVLFEVGAIALTILVASFGLSYVYLRFAKLGVDVQTAESMNEQLAAYHITHLAD